MKKIALSITLAIVLVFLISHPGAGLNGEGIVRLKKAGISDETIAVIVKEKAIETAAFSVQEIVDMKTAGLSEVTIRMVITENSFLKNSDPVVYGEKVRTVRFTTVKDIIDLKNAGVSDAVIQAILTVVGDSEASRELFETYGSQIRRIVRVRLTSSGLRRFMDSQDICQSVMANSFMRAASGQFDLQNPDQLSRRYAFQLGGRFRAWNDKILRAASIGRRLEAQPPRRVAAQNIAAKYTVGYDIAIIGRDTFRIVGSACHRFFQVRPLLNSDEVREDLFTNGIQKK